MNRIQFRRDTTANWAAHNPVLAEGEIGIVTDNVNLYKLGNGVNSWNELAYRGFDGTITQTTGDAEDAVMSQKATTDAINSVIGEVLVTELDNMSNTFINNDQRGYYIVKDTFDKIVGTLMIFTDASNHMLSQILNTNYTLNDDGTLNFGSHVDNAIFTYKRMFHISGGTSDIPSGKWGRWTDKLDNLISNVGIDQYPTFSVSRAYSAGDVVNYQGKLYKFTSDHAAGAWTGGDVEPYNLKKDIEERYGTYTDNLEFIRAYTDAEGKFLWGIRIDGSIEWAKGIPTPIQNALRKLETKLSENISSDVEDLKEALETKIKELQDAIDLINAALKPLTDTFVYQENEKFVHVITDSNDKILFGIPTENFKSKETNLFKTIIPTRINNTEQFTCPAYIDDNDYVYTGQSDKITKYLVQEYKRIEKKGDLEIHKIGTSQYVRSIVNKGDNIFVSLRGNGFGYWTDDTKKAEFRALWDNKDVMSGVFTDYIHDETSFITYVDNVDSPGRGMGSCKLSGNGDCYLYLNKDIAKGEISLFFKYNGVSDCYFPILKNGDDNVLGLVVANGKLGIKVNNQDYLSSSYALSDDWINVKVIIDTANVDLYVRSKECQNDAWNKISNASVVMNQGNKIGIGLSSSNSITAYVDDIEYNPTDIESVSYNAGRIVIVNKNDMSLVKSYDLNIRAHGMIIDGSTLYVALNGGMNVYRIASDNNSLILLSAFRYSDFHYLNKLWASEMQNIALFNASGKKYIAATCYTMGVIIIDVTDLSNVTQVIRYDDIPHIWGSGGLYHEWDVYVQYPYIFTTVGASHVIINQGANVPTGKRIITGIKVRDITNIQEPDVKIISVPEFINPYPVTKDPLPISLTKIGQYLFLGYGDKGIGVFEIDGMNSIYKCNLLPNYSSNSAFVSNKKGFLYITDSYKLFDEYSINLSSFKI